MDLERLSEFAQAARCGSMKKLSEETGVPQATLAARLRSFENELGVWSCSGAVRAALY